MPRIRFISALAISIALIGGAMWFRFVRITPYAARVVTVSQIEETSSEDDLLLTDFFSTGTSSPATPAAALSQTDLIGRQIFSDYMELKSRDEATPENIAALADKYAEGAKNIDLSIPKVNLNQVIVLSDSEANLAVYGNTITNIRNKYKNLVAAQTANSGGDITDTNSEAFSIFMGTLGKFYQAAANELLLVGAPTSLASNHLNLINQYLETAEVMRLISKASEDPARAYAALNLYTKNGGKESELLMNIQKILLAHGIIFSSI